MSGAAFARAEAGGILLDIRLTPRGGRDTLDGIATLADGRIVLLARVRAVPEKGAANTALATLVADQFGLPKSSVSVVSGHTARLKTLRIAGEPAVLLARAAELPPEREVQWL
ncbi:hypothetical protein SAMN02745157_4042 [Kaistia soli DSM 19436]|uniref:UPF0235 protein SAMN02745157_4042 n=1 Tax=Kaistia soli DSM 19436 TaxID=1122133 RepID=A0A1M5IYA5_9HYPH|nr:DUF167 family protein [Kaistia soli]SHG33302.1 hypothetical protein SAMN02745157_4042 [Kaistia soli DSM 19436]